MIRITGFWGTAIRSAMSEAGSSPPKKVKARQWPAFWFFFCRFGDFFKGEAVIRITVFGASFREHSDSNHCVSGHSDSNHDT